MPKGQPLNVPDDGLTTRQRRNRPLQFVKSAKWRIGEQTVLERLGKLHEETGEGGPVDWHKMGSGWSWSRKQGDAEDHAAAAAEGWAEIKRCLADERYDLLVLDEFTYPIKGLG